MLAVLGDSVTTDHISPAGAIKKDSPAGRWLIDQGVEVRDFNSYGSRRGNHEVMIRGTFANVRLRNRLVEREGGFTRHFPDGEETTIYEAAMRYADEGVPLVVLAGKEYGSGSSRDWAAKGTALLGVRAVIAESYRAHPPLEPDRDGSGAAAVPGRRGRRLAGPHRGGGDRRRGPRRGACRPSAEARKVRVTAARDGADPVEFEARVRLDTPERGRAITATAASCNASCATFADLARISQSGPVRLHGIGFLLTLVALMHQNAVTHEMGDFQGSSPASPASGGDRVGIPPWLPTRRRGRGLCGPPASHSPAPPCSQDAANLAHSAGRRYAGSVGVVCTSCTFAALHRH